MSKNMLGIHQTNSCAQEPASEVLGFSMAEILKTVSEGFDIGATNFLAIGSKRKARSGHNLKVKHSAQKSTPSEQVTPTMAAPIPAPTADGYRVELAP